MIHEFDINLICEFFSHVERQGPGSPEMTIKGLSFISELNEQSKIIDIGCGTGGQTMVLAPVRKTFLETHKGNKGVEEFIAYEQHEMELYSKYKAFYGYVFYIGKKI